MLGVVLAACALVAPFGRAMPVLNRGLTPFSWADTKYLFAFGDSYTASGYNVSAGILSPDPQIGWADGYTWVEFLAHDYNATDTHLFNMAYGGATIDAAVVPPYLGTVISLKTQILSEFGTHFVPAPAEAPWTSEDSLFVIYIGINDVDNSFRWTNVSQPEFRVQLLNEWEGLVDQLYAWGARKFLFLDVPPVDRSPAWVSQGATTAADLKGAIEDFNHDLATHVANLTWTHWDARFMIFEDSKVYGGMLDDPAPFGIKNTTAYCPSYGAFVDNPPSPITYLPECGIPVLEYFFLDALHPTGTVHNQIGKQVAGFLDLQSVIL